MSCLQRRVIARLAACVQTITVTKHSICPAAHNKYSPADELDEHSTIFSAFLYLISTITFLQTIAIFIYVSCTVYIPPTACP